MRFQVRVATDAPDHAVTVEADGFQGAAARFVNRHYLHQPTATLSLVVTGPDGSSYDVDVKPWAVTEDHVQMMRLRGKDEP